MEVTYPDNPQSITEAMGTVVHETVSTTPEAVPAEAVSGMIDVEQARDRIAQLEAEIARLKAAQERPRSRAEIVAEQREKIRNAKKKVKEAAGKVVDEAILLTDPDGRKIVLEDVRGVAGEARRRGAEAKDRVVKKGVEVVTGIAKKGTEVMETGSRGGRPGRICLGPY